MKTCLIAVVSLVCTSSVSAQEFDSKVINQYRYVGLNVGYVPEHDSLPSMIGLRLDGSFEFKNFLIWLKAETYVDTGDAILGADMERTSGGIGYVIRLDGNRINLVPRLGGSGLRITQDALSGSATVADTTAIVPSITLSYAFSERFGMDAGYAVVVATDSGRTVSEFSVGATFPFAERWGVNVDGTVATDKNYNGIFAGVTFHF